jgi:16S rRNA processing protein RimM
MSAKKYVALGYVSAVHGLRGWVRLRSWTRPPAAIFDYQPWLLGDDRRSVRLEESRRQGKSLLALLAGVTDRDQAAGLVGQQIAVERRQLPPTAEDEYYWADLIGLEVRTRDGRSLGHVDRLLETGAHDVLVIQGERERLVPFVPGRYVKRVDLEGGWIEVDWDPEF